MKLKSTFALLAMAAVTATGSARVAAVGEVSRAVGICAQATSRLGVDDRPFRAEAWATEAVDGLPGDRFYSKGDLRASLGMRPGIGGSCIISFTVRSAYDLAPLTESLERAFHVKALASGPAFALLPLPDKLLQGQVTPTPIGSVVSVAVDMRD